MDDNEAEVDLAVSASLLKKISDDNEQPHTPTTADSTDVPANQDAESPEVESTSTENIAADIRIEKSEDVPQVEVDEGNQVASSEDAVDVGGPPPPPTAEEARSSEGDVQEGNNEDEVQVVDEEDLASAPETPVIGVSSVVSRDHIPPTPPFTVSNKIKDEEATPTTTGTNQTSPIQGVENSSGGTGEYVSQDSDLLSNDNLGRVVEMTIKSEEEGERVIPVRIVDASYKKPFLGGFRNKRTGIEYLNASCQTYARKVIPKSIEVFSRDTQTVEKKSQVQQTMYDTSTQMTKPGCYVSDATDVVIIPGKYVTAAEVEAKKLEKVIILQSYWRRWLATQYVQKLRIDREMRIEWERKEAERLAAERAERLRLEFERRMKPKSKSDFDLLYAALEGWRQEEMERINNSHSGPERKAALIALLEQEAYLIQSIERHRLNADEVNYSDNVVKFLDKAAQPKFWRAYDGKKTEMNTKYSLRAQELRDIYNTLQKAYLNQDERLDILLTLKHTVKEHDCKITQEMIELIDREADLLTRNVKSANLEGLRQRISTLFLQYCKTPAFNPDVARLLKVPKDSSALRKDIYFCPSCNSYLPSTEFPLASNSRIVGRCIKCSKLDNNARLRHDFTKIRSILQHLRRTEEAFNDGSKIAFIIQDADLRYLIEKIWNSQSALSGVEDLYDLVFVRWNKHEHWSPWNCLLLTKEEASAHMKLECITEAYGRIFVGKVHHRHVVAKQYFSKLTNISDNMQKNALPQPSSVKKVAAM